GYKEAAEKFREEANIHYPVESCVESLDARIRIRVAIREGRIRDAIRMINDLYPSVLDVNQYLHFHLLRFSTLQKTLLFLLQNFLKK
uniref:CTLH domain-containing protein n=1 Tax=Romanomermis culicivorax TaxID=13658 RepID=A0A915JHD9_ROMCU